jgi:hypothetical protein
MINIKFNSEEFLKDMTQVVEYSAGFVEGAKLGKVQLLENIGSTIVEAMKQFIDANARVNPSSLHHVYEWYKTGSPDARLFEINYVANNVGLSFNSTFRQSVSIKAGSKVPFYDKAEIMERGLPVTIIPKARNPLIFEDNGKTVFTKLPVTVSNPGGDSVAGGYERMFDQFFSSYFTQSFLRSSGILDHLNDPTPFKRNLSRAKTGGRNLGINVGYRWIAKSKGGVIV